jgi:hypothetical protein
MLCTKIAMFQVILCLHTAPVMQQVPNAPLEKQLEGWIMPNGLPRYPYAAGGAPRLAPPGNALPVEKKVMLNGLRPQNSAAHYVSPPRATGGVPPRAGHYGQHPAHSHIEE